MASGDGSSDDSIFSLSDLADSVVSGVGSGISGGISSAIGNLTRSSNTAPAPDIAANAAKPASTFIKPSVLGISIPILIIGGGVLVYILLRRK